jgi:hydroxymethylbilane synthase
LRIAFILRNTQYELRVSANTLNFPCTVKKTLTIGSRRSRLAQTQTNIVRQMLLDAWNGLKVDIVFMDTQGDLNRHDPLPAIGGKGLFTAELEAALREDRIDLAVHSLKDLPVEDSPGLAVAAVPERADTQDLLISHQADRLEDLPSGAVVGTSSLRRAAQILALRPDLRIKDIRGNVDTRLRKLDDPAYGYDAILLALAGLQRLGHTDLPYAHPIPLATVLPAPGQGALAVQARANDAEIRPYLLALEHPPTRAAVTAERAFLAGLGGGCSLPVAALGTVIDHHLDLQALVASADGRRVIRVSGSASAESAQALGRQLAAEALVQGAQELLQTIRSA